MPTRLNGLVQAQLQHRPPQERMVSEKMETHGQDMLPYGEGVKPSKTQGKDPSPSQQKKKTKKKKKKKGAEEDEKPPSKSKKQPVFRSSPELHSNTTREDASEETASRTTNQLFSAASNVLLLTEGNSGQSNESLRWNGILDDPAAEEERLRHYRVDRRKRYVAYIQQSLPPELSLTLRHLPQLCKVAHLSGNHFLRKAELTTTSQNSKT
ncbi:protein LIAT1 isoform X2 [Sphaerodactylus townsendi]|uniref:protein LIAT1 isoform X2 n=1 Tax=Sphaerodactylus townsendi TaxID=933632 RepID=UPI0020263881|nr:protein LIAT1 isoform X2 [Sphaerodactylus townsendi]